MSIQQRGNEALLVNAHGNGLADRRVLDDAACHVHRAKECARSLNAGELIVVVFKVGIRLIRHTVGGVNVSGLQRRRERVAVGKRADGQLVDLWRTVPVCFILRQCQMIVRDHFLDHIGTCANHNASIKITCIHINDAAVGVAKIVHQGRIRFAGCDGQNLTICLHIRNFGVARCAVMVFQQMLKALLDRCCVHDSPIGERDVILQDDRPCQIAVIFPRLCQPRFKFHAVRIMNQRFADTIADARPAVVGAVGVNSLFPVF